MAEVRDRIQPAIGHRSREFQPGDPPPERRVEPCKDLRQLRCVQIPLEFEPDPRVERLSSEALRHDPVDRDAVLAAERAPTPQELHANAG